MLRLGRQCRAQRESMEKEAVVPYRVVRACTTPHPPPRTCEMAVGAHGEGAKDLSAGHFSTRRLRAPTEHTNTRLSKGGFWDGEALVLQYAALGEEHLLVGPLCTTRGVSFSRGARMRPNSAPSTNSASPRRVKKKMASEPAVAVGGVWLLLPLQAEDGALLRLPSCH